jgi:hypothetical protein
MVIGGLLLAAILAGTSSALHTDAHRRDDALF